MKAASDTDALDAAAEAAHVARTHCLVCTADVAHIAVRQADRRLIAATAHKKAEEADRTTAEMSTMNTKAGIVRADEAARSAAGMKAEYCTDVADLVEGSYTRKESTDRHSYDWKALDLGMMMEQEERYYMMTWKSSSSP
jgi:uncharacterized radical SAM superfamily Fe-S cluster-containing enzyme